MSPIFHRPSPMLRTLCLLLVLLPAATAQAPELPGLCGRLETLDGQRVLSLWGTPEQRGYAQGWLLAETIKECIEADFGRFLGGDAAGVKRYENQLLRLVVPRFRFSSAERAELEAMVRGFEARSGPAGSVIPLLGRRLRVEDLMALNTVGDWTALGCSTIAFSGERMADGAPACARNFDYPALRALLTEQLVVVRAPLGEARGWVGVSHPGALALLTGMNDAGVFVSIHDVPVKTGLLAAFRRNVPRLLALRRLLERLDGEETVSSAHELTRSWPTLFGNNFMVVGPGRPFAGVLEYDNRVGLDGGTTLRRPGEEGWLACTNHHRARGEAGSAPARCRRYRRLSEAATPDAEAGMLELEDLLRIVDLAAVPGPGRKQRAGGFGTLHQAIGLVGRRELHVRFGAAGSNIRERAWQRLDVARRLALARP